jgi:hypothetical protein
LLRKHQLNTSKKKDHLIHPCGFEDIVPVLLILIGSSQFLDAIQLHLTTPGFLSLSDLSASEGIISILDLHHEDSRPEKKTKTAGSPFIASPPTSHPSSAPACHKKSIRPSTTKQKCHGRAQQ